MKQIIFNSKRSFLLLVAIFVPVGCIQDDTRQTAARTARNFRAKGLRIFLWRSFRKWLSCVSLVTLIGALVLSGCTSKDSEESSGGHGKQMPQKQDNATTKPVQKEVGEASWYGRKFQGQETANGETFNQHEMTAAHPSLPMGTIAKVTNLDNGKKVDVRINDRGPFNGDRAIDLSSAAAKKIDMKKGGTTEVKIETKSTKKDSSKMSGKTKHRAKGRDHRRRKQTGT